jgi:two-component system chemotaxis response regulator CheY
MSGLRKVLIVDDSKLIHHMYRLVLMRFRDCKIVDAMNEIEALDILAKENDFDLLVLDVNMPIMNGMHFMEMVRETGIVRGAPPSLSSAQRGGRKIPRR